ncbi:hypothetical protein EV424DRAFT_1544886 [Suillus variegatus]|nr:hypothetical protein EV424DRAFT_1544886 [Suillus variegatus]
MSPPEVHCIHNRHVQMLPHPCFTLEQFIEAIRLVQCGYVPPLRPQPFGWPYRPEGEECDLHTQSGSQRDVMDSPGDEPADIDSHQDVMDSPGDEPADLDTSIKDIWIGAANDTTNNATNNATNDVLPGSEPEYDYELEAANASAETLINLDPASQFKWFVTVCHYGVGLFNDIHTARKLHSGGTTVHYFTTLDAAQAHFRDVFNVWCGEAA